jgi:tryptophan-rich sensory protein
MMQFLRDWAPTLIAAGGVTVLAFAGMMLTTLDRWYYGLKKPSWQPPDWLFGPAWTLIFILEAASAVICWHVVHGTAGAAWLIGAYIANGLFNILWSLFFFKLRRPDWGLAEVPLLWLSVLAMILVLAHYAGPAWLFLLPYLLWVSFAAFLNYTIVRLNAPFKEAA